MSRADALSDGERAELVARYRGGYGALLATLEGLTAGELDWRPAQEAWSVRDVVHHLEDAELTGAVRLRRLLTEDAPFLPAFDEEIYRRRLAYAARPIEPALDAIRAAHVTTAELLDRLTADDWRRAGTHSEEGPYPLARWLAFHATHTHEHAAQIRQLRLARIGAAPAPAAPPSAHGTVPAAR
jgi:DinB family protein